MSNLINSISSDGIERIVDLENEQFKIIDYKASFENKDLNIIEEIIEIESIIIENTKMLFNNPKYNSLNQNELLNLNYKRN